MTAATPWWQTAVVHQLYPRSFASSDPATPAGVGDLEGIRGRLEHLMWLGVDAVWLSPFFRSPMADFGYDVSDYCDVDPLFGTLEDFDRLAADAHALGLKVLVDWVPNHSSDQHPWFQESRSSRDNPKRDWYIWRDPAPDGSPPNNWMAAFLGVPAWTLDAATGQYYLHSFLAEQPDLNWANPDVVAAMHDTLRFWLDRGVDGFRMDVVHLIGKDPADLVDWAEGSVPVFDLPEMPHVHALIRGFRQLLDSYPGERVMVGEVVMSTAWLAAYYGQRDGLHLSFNFPPLYAPWDADVWRRRVDRTMEVIDPVGWPTWVLSNHDNPRHRTRYGGSEARARAAAVLLLGLRGTPFLYAGEELGLEDAVVPPERVVDPGGRDGCRAPIPWDGTAEHGWATTDPWLPWPPTADVRNAEALRSDPTSILHLYRRLLAARRASPALHLGRFEWVEAPEGVLAWEREHEGDRRRIVVSMGAEPIAVDALDGWLVEVSSDGTREDSTWSGELATDAAVVCRP